jgi:DNA-binding transcriptional LysR family regulator
MPWPSATGCGMVRTNTPRPERALRDIAGSRQAPMNIMKLDIHRMIAFQLVARSGNIRYAAARLKQTPPAISTKIRLFEKDLGVELFQRLPNKLVLTAEGERFLVEVDAFVARGEEALATLTTGGSYSGKFTAAIGNDHGWYFLPRIAQFLKRFPNVKLSLEIGHADDAIQGLNEGRLDVSFGVFPKLPRGLEQVTVAETSLSLVCPVGHPLLRRPSPTLAEIAQQRLIVLPKHTETRKIIDGAFARNGMRVTSIIEVGTCQMASAFVEMGLGIAIVHSYCIDHSHSEKVRWIDLGQKFEKVAFSIVFRKLITKPQLVNYFIEELTK